MLNNSVNLYLKRKLFFVCVQLLSSCINHGIRFSECKIMDVHLLLWAVLTVLTGDGYISALSRDSAQEATRIPKIRHKSFSFNDDDDISESDTVEENIDGDSNVKIQQFPKAQPSRSNGKPKSILEKLVREPELGKNSVFELKHLKPCRQSIRNSIQSQMACQKLHSHCFVLLFLARELGIVELN